MVTRTGLTSRPLARELVPCHDTARPTYRGKNERKMREEGRIVMLYRGKNEGIERNGEGTERNNGGIAREK